MKDSVAIEQAQSHSPSGDDERAAAPQARHPGEAALHALCLVARLHQVPADPAALLHQLGKSPSEPVSADDLLLAARHLGLKAKLSSTTIERIELAALPALAVMKRVCLRAIY